MTRLGKRIAIALLLLPLAEVVAFLLVAWAIGFFPALGLMILTSAAGGVVLHRGGRSQIAQARVAVRQRGIADVAAQPGGVLVALGGILLLLPGFITDLLGLGLLVGPLRRWLGAAIGRVIRSDGRPTGPRGVIDLGPDEWRSVPDQELPDQR